MGEIAEALLTVIGKIKQQQNEPNPIGKKKWDKEIADAIQDLTTKCMTSLALDQADESARKLHSQVIDLEALAAIFPD